MKSKTIALLAVLMMLITCSLVSCTRAVKSISLSETVVNLEPGKSASIHAIFQPDNATDQKVTWTSSDYAVANVVDGTIYAIADGNATIKAVSSNGKSASCTVRVSTPSAYSKLNSHEKKFFDTLKSSITQFKNPGSVSVVKVDYDSGSSTTFVAEIKAMNGFGGITATTYKVTSIGLYEGGYLYSSGSNFDVAKINAALTEYIAKQGW